jgi:type VI secretion system protein VasG
MQISRRALFGKLNGSLFKALESATAYAKLKNQHYVEICHWIWHFSKLPDTDLQVLIAHSKLDAARIEWELRAACEQQPTGTGGILDFGHQVLKAVEKAWIQASLVNSDRKIRSAWLISAMLGDAQLRLALQSTAPTLMRIDLPSTEADWKVLLEGSREQTERACDELDLPSAIPGEASSALNPEKQTNSHLELYCTDLSEQAKSGK